MFQNRSIDHLRASLAALTCKGCMHWDWTKREGELAPCDRAADPRRVANLGEDNVPVRVVALPMLTHEQHFCAEHMEPTAHGKKLRARAEAETKDRAPIKVPVFGFRLEIDGIGDVNLTSCGKLREFATCREVTNVGGNKFATEPMPCVRVRDLNDNRILDWWRTTRSGVQDIRNGTYFWVKAGVDVAKMAVERISIADYDGAQGDAKGDGLQMERFTIKPAGFGEVIILDADVKASEPASQSPTSSTNRPS